MSEIDRRIAESEWQLRRIIGFNPVIKSHRWAIMSSRAHEAPLNQSTDLPLYSKAELIDLRRTIILHARFLPPGAERNQHRQIALSLGTLFRNEQWLDANTSP